MTLQALIREAARSISRQKLRSGLAALGISIGVAAVVLVAAIGQAGKERAEDTLRGLGDNLVWVEAGSRNVAGVRTGTHGTTSLTVDDAEAIQRDVHLIKRISPQIDGTIQGHSRSAKLDDAVPGRVTGLPDDQDDGTSRGEVVSLTTMSTTGGEQGTDRRHGATGGTSGRTIPLGASFERQANCSRSLASSSRKDSPPMAGTKMIGFFCRTQPPTTTLRGRGPMWTPTTSLFRRFRRTLVGPAIAQIVGLLRERHQIGGEEEDDFNIRRPDEIIKAQVSASDSLAALLLCVGLISLLVGGIGIMNVMLASVTQRTRGIGLRMAVGATRAAITLQFLTEAVMLCLVGGLAGLLASAAGASGAGQVAGWQILIFHPGHLCCDPVLGDGGPDIGVLPSIASGELGPNRGAETRVARLAQHAI